MLQRYGKGTRLFPLVSIDGKAYGFAWLIYPAPSGNNDGVVVCTGTVQSVVDLGGGRWRVVCKRDYQFSDYDKFIEGEGVTNIETRHLAGGNVVNSLEWMRALSHANPMAVRGSLEASRMIVGDGVRFLRGAKVYLWEVVECEAYGFRNPSVNYVGELGTVPPNYVVSDVNEVELTRDTEADALERLLEDGSLFFLPGAAAPLDGSSLFIKDGGTFTEAERLIFTNPTTGAADPYFLPTTFGAGLSGSKYWWDPIGMRARLLSSCADDGNEVLLSWYVRNVTTCADAPKASPVVLEPTAATTGHADGADAVLLSGFTADPVVDVHFTAFKEGFAFWRLNTLAGSPSIWASVSSGGVVTVRKRDTSGGTVSTVATSAALSFPFQVRLERTGGDVSVYTRATVGSGSWALLATDSPSSVAEVATGLIGWGSEGASTAYALDNVSDTVPRTLHQIGAARGTQSFYRYKTVPFGVTRQYPLGSTQPIARVVNASAGVDMTESATPRRDTYALSGGNLVLYSESAGDEIRIEFEPFEEVPPGPGSPPRTFDQPGLATFAEEPNPDRLATEDPDENRINWSDQFEFVAELPGWEPVAGETFEVVRGAGVWPHDADLDFFLDVRNDEGSDWTTIPEADLFVLKYRGLVLLEESARAEHEGQALCLLVDGARYVVESVTDSINEHKHGLEALEGLWINYGTPEGGFGGISGYAQISKGATTNSLRTFNAGGTDYQTWWQDGACWGLSKEQVDGWWEREPHPPPPTYLNAAMPYWWAAFRRDLRMRSGPFPSLPIVNELTAPPSISGQDEVYEVGPDDHVPGEYAMQYNAFGTDGPNRFGSLLYQSEASAAVFSLAPVGFNIRRLALIPSGATVLEAKIRAKFTGLKFRSWTYELMSKLAGNRPDATGLEGRLKITVNGYVETWTETGTGIDDTFEEPPEGYEWETSGPITFACLAARKDSRLVIDRTGVQYEVPAYEIISGGPTLGGSGSLVTDGEWCIVDCADLVRFALAMVDTAAADDAIMLVPSVGAPTAGSPANADSLGAYIDSLMPTLTAAFDDGFPDYKRETYSAAGAYAEFEGLEFGELMVRLRLGDGPAEWMALPLITPAMM